MSLLICSYDFRDNLAWLFSIETRIGLLNFVNFKRNVCANELLCGTTTHETPRFEHLNDIENLLLTDDSFLNVLK